MEGVEDIMSKKRIVLILERAYFNPNYAKAYDLDYFKENGYIVEIWSVANWKFHLLSNPEEKISGYTVRNISTPEEFDDQMRKVKDIFFFAIEPYHIYDWISGHIRKQIKKNGYEYCNIGEETSPSLANTKAKIPQNSVELKVWLLWRVFRGMILDICSIVLHFVKFILKADIEEKNQEKELLMGAFSRMIYPICYPSTLNFMPLRISMIYVPQTFELLSHKNIIVDSKDYYRFLENKNTAALVQEPYIVFIDQALTQDTQNTKLGSMIEEKEKYFSLLNQFFQTVENIYGYPVIIAAHPKGKYVGDEFGERKIITGSTDNLILHAKLVIIMYSTSISYVLLGKKKFIQISVHELLKKNGYHKRIPDYYDCIERELGIATHDIVKPYNDEKVIGHINEYDEYKYTSFMEKYVCDDVNNTQNKRFGEIVLNAMLEKTKNETKK